MTTRATAVQKKFNHFCLQFKNFWSQPLWSPEWAWSGSTNSFQGVHPSSPRVGGPVAWRPSKNYFLGDLSFGDFKKFLLFATAQPLVFRGAKTWHLQNPFLSTCHFFVLNILIPKTKQEETCCKIGLCKILSTRIKSLSLETCHIHTWRACTKNYWGIAVS